MLKDKYLNTSEVAKLLGFVPSHVRRLIIQGKIKAEKVGSCWLILPSNLKDVKRLRG